MENIYSNFRFKVLLAIASLFLWSFTLRAATYYVSATGDDNRSSVTAQNSNTPWKTLAHISEISGSFQSGDQILFKRGEVFLGTLAINASGSSGNPIVFGAYGDGALPEITGFVNVTGWQQKSGNIWESAVPGGLSYLNNVVINGAAKAVGRYPNISAANKGYLTYDSFNSNTSITDGKLAGQNWTGGQLVMRKNRWIIDRNEITSQNGTTINYASPSGYGGSKGYGYFIQNHPSTLNTEGEWYYQNGKLGIYAGSNPANYQVRASITETLVQLNNQNNLSFQNLRFSGSALNAFEINASQNISISNCELVFSGKNAINANNTQAFSVANTLVSHTNNNAISINGNGTILQNNHIKNSGINAGMGDNGDGTYEGISILGDNNQVTGNTIDSTGYIALNFSGNNVSIKNNYISNFDLIKDDGGGIYTWNNSSNPPQNTGRVVSGNIVLNGIGAPSGTDDNQSFAHGIYIDDNAGQVEISGNTVANCATYGLFVHNAHDLIIKQNTLYNNGTTQLVLQHDNVAADKPVYNCIVTGNIMLAKTASQLAAEYKTQDNDITNFGTFDQNYYYRPINNDLVIGVLQQINGTYSYKTLSVDSWKALYGKDAGSSKPLHNISPYVVNKVIGNNQLANGTFDANINGLYAYASAGNCTTTWSNGNLDGGALKVTFSSTTNSNNYGSVIIGVGGVTAGKVYRLKFSMLGSNTNKAVTAYLRQSAGGYSDLSLRNAVTISNSRTEKEFLLTATATESNASVVFDVPEQTAAVYLDNIKLEQVDATATNPDQYLSFFYNTNSSTQNFSTGGLSYDATGNKYTNTIKLDPYSSAILVQDTAATNTTGSVAAVNCTATGTILHEEWDNVGGTNIADIPLQNAPTSTSQLTSFEGPTNIADNYGSRIRGYICAPQTGAYTFWLASDDSGELWLSTDDNPANKIRIANVDGWANYREFGKYASQKSTQITLQAGKKYYVEALQKEGGGGDNLSVQWQLPDATIETPIAGSHLSPYVVTTAAIVTSNVTGSGSILREEWDNVGGTNIADIPLQNAPTSTSQVTSFEGPKDIADNYGSRIRGYVFAPQTGNYTFWLASDDSGELWLSTDDNPANKTRIANVDGWANYREFGKYASQKSVTITLEAGKKYYIEALQKEGGGGDNLSVQWQLPDGSTETPIAGIHLSPYVATAADQTITFAAINTKTAGDAPFSLSATASSGLAVTFNVVSGPATISDNILTITSDGTVIVAASQTGNTVFNAAKTVSQSFTVMLAPVTCAATGTILREEWQNVPGNNISDFSFQTQPTSNSQLTAFEGPTNRGENYASRIRGYICAPQTGNYIFWIAGDDAAELYISSDDNPANKVRIANLLSWTNFREWTKFGSQQSTAISLVAGKKYYIEAIQKQGGGGDNLSVQWQLPGGTIESPLPGKYLSPYNTSASNNLFVKVNSSLNSSLTSTAINPETVRSGLFIYPNPATEQSTIEFTLPDAGQTAVMLYNTKGQLMSRLFDGATAANAKISFKLNVAAMQNGVYLIYLTSGKNILTKKLIVVK